MNLEEALVLLNLAPGCSQAELEQASAEVRAEVERELATAPTPSLKERYQRKLRDLDTAFTVLQSATAASPPQGAPARPSPAATRRPGASPQAPALTTRPAQTPAGHSIVPKGILVVGGAIVLLLALYLLFRPSAGNATQAPPTTTIAVVDVAKSPVDELLKQAAEKLSAGDNSAALELYRKVLEHKPDHALALSQLTQLSNNRGRVRVETSPPGAMAHLVRPGEKPGNLTGRSTPAEFVDLPLGAYVVHVGLDGYAPVAPSPIELRSTETKMVGIELKRQTGTMAISVDPAGAKFVAKLVKSQAGNGDPTPVEKNGSVSGRDAEGKPGRTELKDLPTGTYLVELPEFSQTRQVEIVSDQLVEVAFSVSPKPAAAKPSNDKPDPATGSANPAPAGAKNLTVTTERATYKNGEDVTCVVDIPFDGHLRMYSIDVNGQKVQIFPNGYETNGAVRAGTRVRIPGNNEYTLKLDLPPDSKGGEEKVVAVLSPSQFEGGVGPDADNPFPSIEASTDLKTRGLSPKAVGNAASGTGSYRVSP